MVQAVRAIVVGLRLGATRAIGVCGKRWSGRFSSRAGDDGWATYAGLVVEQVGDLDDYESVIIRFAAMRVR